MKIAEKFMRYGIHSLLALLLMIDKRIKKCNELDLACIIFYKSEDFFLAKHAMMTG